MDPGDLEQYALRFYGAHGLDPERPRTTAALARLELGADAIVRAPLTTSGAAVLFRHNGELRIGVKRGLPREYQLHAVGHELAHVLLEREGYRESDLEAACDYLSAAIGAPAPSVRRIYRCVGLDLAELAKAMNTTQTGGLLRVGEVREVALAAMSPRAVRTRGPEAFAWPDEATIRRWARGDRPGLTKVPITDGRGRCALVAGDE